MKTELKFSSIILTVIGFGLLLVFLTTCKKDCCNNLSKATIPVLTTDTVSSITQTTVQCGGTITSDGGDTITARGVCWSIAQSPTIADSLTSDSIGVGSFTSLITGLTANTTYYVRAYATNSVGTGYGNQRTFSTLAALTLPILTTDPLTNIAQTTATSGGNITSDGGSPVTERGVCWSVSPGPTTADSKTLDGSGTGTFVSNLTGLTANTTYYLRAYATNIIGTAYGNEEIFTTLPVITIPTVTTLPPSNITQITFTSGGDVTSDGGAFVTIRGVCWSTAPDPTTSDPSTYDGNGLGSFISQVTNLQSNTFYYVRAYATNSIGTAYGNQVTCGTVANGDPCPGTPYVTYGQLYNTVMIGTQCWLKENLNIGTRIDGILEQTNNNPNYIEKYCYDDDEANCDVYGGLYQWGEMVQYLNGASNTTTWNPPPTGNVQGICPPGWHIPSNNETWQMIAYLGGGFVAGGPMKESGLAHWWSPNTGATNLSGFTALPAGTRDYLTFWCEGQNFFIWSLDERDYASAEGYELFYNSTDASGAQGKKEEGRSVRCVKD